MILLQKVSNLTQNLIRKLTISFTNSKTEARVLKAVKALKLTQVKESTKQQFVDDALNYYIDQLVNKKIIKM